LNDGVSGGELFDVGEMCFSGSINIVSKTCTTPDITVDMGSYSLNTLKVKGKTTGWKDASIHLVNCPVFYGRGEESSSTRWSQNGSSTVADNIENVISVKITPGTDVLDDEKGIFSLTKETDSAQGIGVQLAYGTADMADIFALSKSKDFPRPLNSSGEVTIPLVARYIQTEDKVSSGQADSIATYTISYR
jgi:type 1 fimbria pilin